jgi:hypothetical protein
MALDLTREVRPGVTEGVALKVNDPYVSGQSSGVFLTMDLGVKSHEMYLSPEDVRKVHAWLGAWLKREGE